MVDDNEIPGLPSSPEFKLLVEQANGGDPAALEQLRSVLDNHPQIWQQVGDVARHAELLVIRLVAGEDELLMQSLRRKLDDLKAQLGGDSPSPLERLAVERITSCWLQLQHIDALVAKATPGTVEATFLLKRQGQADRAYTAAVKALTTIRQLLPAGGGDFGRQTTSDSEGTAASDGDRPAVLPMSAKRHA